MTSTTWIQGVLEQAFASRDFRTLATHLAPDVVFEITPPGGGRTTSEQHGREAVLEYFTSLGDIVTFWRVQSYGGGERVVVVGAESFNIPRSDCVLGGEFALLLHVCDRTITRFLIIEDLTESPALEGVALEIEGV
jgi:ketosteroid isomerase-like protein